LTLFKHRENDLGEQDSRSVAKGGKKKTESDFNSLEKWEPECILQYHF